MAILFRVFRMLSRFKKIQDNCADENWIATTLGESKFCEFKGFPNELALSCQLRTSDLFRSDFRRTMVTNGNGVR